MLKKFAIIFIVLFVIINISGCGSKSPKEQAKTALTIINVCKEKTNENELAKQQEQFTKFYEETNNIKIKSKDIHFVDSLAADTYKNLEGYPTIYGIMSANNGLIINGNVAVYGGLYTQDEVKMANGAHVIINSSYIDKIATINKYNGDVFLKDKMDDENMKKSIPAKPVNMQNVKRKIKLINISEEETKE